MDELKLSDLLAEVLELRRLVTEEGDLILSRWNDWLKDSEFAGSASNFACYLSLRHHDLRDLQKRLMQAGLSSLGRAESRVLPSLDAVIGLLESVSQGVDWCPVSSELFNCGDRNIAARADSLLGQVTSDSPIRLLVTLPSEAADEPDFLLRLAQLGVEAVRINCAHDDEVAWKRMVDNVNQAAAATGIQMKIMMDLAGPKIRTGKSRDKKELRWVSIGSELAITLPGHLDDAPHGMPAVECSLSEVLRLARAEQRILIDDGKLDTVVRRCEDWGVVVRIEAGPDGKGYKLKPEKGVNFPDTEIDVPALTDEDRAALRFVAHHADGIEFSFVQSPEDIETLQSLLAQERPDDWQKIGLVLKIETQRAVRNLPDLIVKAAGQQPTAVMIARGDLAVEIGFARLAEMQEEILWLCEAAHVPVIWATQVLEGLIKTGVPSRGEMTDAAMAARAECVMLNKGPFVFEGIQELDRLLGRMKGHISKKTHQLRPLQSW
jgi:pyruvate kinase